MKKGLVIGVAGFVGRYLIEEMSKNNMEIYATKLPYEEIDNSNATVYDLDIMDEKSITSLLLKIRPDYIFHLAAQSSVRVAWKNPGLTVDINIKGSINLLQAVRELPYKPRVLLVGSGEEYGRVQFNNIPISENANLKPGNIYAATKACQNMVGNIFAMAYDMEIVMVRAFNHIGPGQTCSFVVSDFCKQVAEIEKGLKDPIIRVGNLEVKRDFTDVRDVVRAYVELIQLGDKGETYNVGSGKARSIQEILNIVLDISKVAISVESDLTRLRPTDVPLIEADISKLNRLTGWKPLIPLEHSIQETLDYWRIHI